MCVKGEVSNTNTSGVIDVNVNFKAIIRLLAQLFLVLQSYLVLQMPMKCYLTVTNILLLAAIFVL